MNIVLIAHDKKKDEMVKLTIAYKDILKDHNLYATGTTGLRIIEATGLDVTRFKSGPLGGDQQIGSLVSENEVDLIIFLRDSLTAQAHEPDITALLRLSDVYDVPVATNMGSAEVMLRGLESKFFDWRDITRGHDKDQLQNENLNLPFLILHHIYIIFSIERQLFRIFLSRRRFFLYKKNVKLL